MRERRVVVEPATTLDPTASRDALVEYVERELIGPAGDTDELIADPPHRRYIMGTLYPQRSAASELETSEQEDVGEGGVGEELADDPIRMAHDWMPSSVGITFYLVDARSLTVTVWGSCYLTEKEGRAKRWRRSALSESAEPETLILACPGRAGGRAEPVAALSGRCELHSRWRPLAQGFLVTVTLVNAAEADEDSPVDPEATVHQVGFSCAPEEPAGRIVEYPQVESLSADDEDQELRIIYRSSKTFAIGHGCAVQWPRADVNVATSVRTQFLPRGVVPGLIPSDSKSNRFLELRVLALDGLEPEELATGLGELADSYEQWIESLPAENKDVPEAASLAVERIMARQRTVLARVRKGIEVLRTDAVAFRAFRLANEAMLMQMRHGRDDLGGIRRSRNTVDPSAITYEESDATWYPFQLAYQLLVIPSLTGAAPDDHDLVDLLWFPTGGGKTEAYLAVAAFEIIRRRLVDAERGAGMAVLTRYTLRLLTAQQFQRAAGLVCALEQLRERNDLGAEPFRIGLWVGSEAAPNTFQGAEELLDELLEEERPTGRFQLEQCPWCGTELYPERREGDRAAYGYEAGPGRFRFYCPTSACAFHDELPVSVVDQDLYRRPPTIVVATVDKLARMAWVADAGAMFGGDSCDPPSLIIQDELHLLSGPLGTTVGVYETAVEALIRLRGGSAKIVASTATIRRADEQSLGLFGKRVAVFPAQGLSADDSYFARVDKDGPGRLYLGVMAPAHTNSFAMVHIMAALLQGQMELPLDPEARDGFGTLVAYHNSLRELGRTVTLARDDVPARITSIAADENQLRPLDDENVVELTSNIAGADLPGILQRMERPIDEPGSISLLASTNMLSVGVDVPRLALMLVNGQPKTTSEYIQASSRVGRSKVPGLVVTLFTATKPRDRSHYERFAPYHSALYRFVEPTSVTPFSPPSRERSLHAALVIMVRHGADLAPEAAAGDFDPDDPRVVAAVSALLERVAVIDSAEAKATKRQLDRLMERWSERAGEADALDRELYYGNHGKQHLSLLKDFGEKGEGWPTMHSMRNIDGESSVYVMGSR